MTEMPTNPKRWHVGLVGYGEVGRILAEDLRKQDVRITAYDLKLGNSQAGPLRDHASVQGVALAASHADLAAKADFIVSAVTASQAVAVAQACAPAVKKGAWFLDFNSASPGAKRRAAELIDGNGGRYVEGAVMTSIPPYRIKVPLLLGGAGAEELAPLLVALGFDAKVASKELGVASAVKMCRSVMIKGLEAMVIESFTTARAYGVEDAVLASLKETYPGIDWEKQGAYFFQRVIEHGRRRSEEVREVAETVREIGLTPWSAQGTAERQAWVAELQAGWTGMPAPRSPDSSCRLVLWTRTAMFSALAPNSPLRPSANTRPAMLQGGNYLPCAIILASRATSSCRPPVTAPTTARWSMRSSIPMARRAALRRSGETSAMPSSRRCMRRACAEYASTSSSASLISHRKTN